MRFRVRIETAGKTATGFEVPAKIVEGLGAGRKPAVRVTMKGYSYRSTVATMGGRFMIPVSADVRQNAGVAGGDDVDIELELDTEPREVTVPADFRQALDRDEAARRAFDALSYSNTAASRHDDRGHQVGRNAAAPYRKGHQHIAGRRLVGAGAHRAAAVNRSTFT